MLRGDKGYRLVDHPVLGQKYEQDGKFFFFDGSECPGDPGTAEGPSAPAETPTADLAPKRAARRPKKAAELAAV